MFSKTCLENISFSLKKYAIASLVISSFVGLKPPLKIIKSDLLLSSLISSTKAFLSSATIFIELHSIPSEFSL